MRFVYVFLTVILIGVMPCFSQKYEHYSVEDGLPGNMVYRVTQDAKGFIWVITDKGIARFNGRNFKKFNTRNGLPTNDIWDVAVTEDNNLWYFSKSSSLGYIDDNKVYDFPSAREEDQLFPANIFEIGNSVFFSYGKQSFHLLDKKWHQIDTAQLASLSPETQMFQRYRDKMGAFTVSNEERYKRALLRGSDSLGIIIGRESYAVLNLNSDEIYEHSYPEELKNKNPGLFRTHKINGELQFTGPEFVAEFDDEFNLVNIESFPADFKAHFAMKDKSGNLWMASLTQGLYKLPSVNRQNSYWMTDHRIRQLEQTPIGIIASVYENGFYKFNSDLNDFVPLSLSDGFIYGSAYIESLSTTFLLSSTELIAIPESGTRKSFPPLARRIVYHKGFLFGNVSSGLNKIDPVSMKVVGRIPEVGVKSLLSFDGKLLVGTANGLKVLEGNALKPLQIGANTLDHPIMSLGALSNGELLITTDGFGAYRTNLKEIHLLEQSEHLSANSQLNKNGGVWLTSGEGIQVYSLIDESINWTGTIGVTDGIPSVNTHSIIATQNGLMVGTDNGVVLLLDTNDKEDQLLDIYVERATYSDSDISEESEVLYSGKASLAFKVESIDFTQGSGEKTFEYRLDPVEDNWSVTSSSVLNFSNLSPDSYTLFLKSGSVTSKYSFTITPLWWQKTTSIILFSVLASLVIFYILLRLRRFEINKKISKLEIQNKLTEFELYALRSQMNPHFVFNSLAAIQYCINSNEIKEAEAYLVKFSRLVRQFFELSKQKEVTVSEEAGLLQNYLDIEKLRFKEKLDYSIRMSPELENSEVTIPTMLLQPVVENAINHGIFNKVSGGRVDINFEHNGNGTLQVEIADNGVGYINTVKPKNDKRRSSDVLEDRLSFLNKTGKWEISYSNKEAFPNAEDRGNITTFIIKAVE